MNVCTDGAKTMTGSIKGVMLRIKKKIQNVATLTVLYTVISWLQKICL